MEALQLKSIQSSHQDKQCKTLKESVCIAGAGGQAEGCQPERRSTSPCQPGASYQLLS